METMNSSNTNDGSQDEPKKKERTWTPDKNLAWELESGATRDKLASEVIEDVYYKEYVPVLKARFKDLFGFEPKVTNSCIMDLDDFNKYHKRLLENPSSEDAKNLAEGARTSIREWVISQITRETYKPESTPEHEAVVDRKIDEAMARIDQLYGWIFQNIPVKQK